MKIINVWSLHFRDFLIQIEGTKEEKQRFKQELKDKFKDKKILVHNCKEGINGKHKHN